MKKSSTTNQNNWRMLLEWLLLLLAGWLSISFSEELNKHVLFISTVILLSVISLKVLRIPILKRFLRNHQRFYDSEAAALRHLGVYALWSCFLIGATQLQAQSCNCQDYMYLNDPQDQVSGRGFVHKFRINANGTFTEIPNATTGTLPWIPMGAGLPNPHGLGQDLNGFIYIGESVGSSSRIRKITCDGSILPLSEFNLQADGYNFTSKDGLIYTNPSSSNRIEAYQSCDGSPAGYIRLNGVPHNNGNFVANELQDWGFEITEDGTFYLSAGILDNDGDDIRAVWRFKPTAADFANHTAFSPIFQLDAAHLPPGATPSWVYGITADPTGNMYVNILDLTLPRTTYIVKYNSAGTLVDWTSEEITQDNMGFEASLGIRYYAPLNVLYMTAQFGDCVAAIDAATMEYIGPVVPHVPGQAGKGVAIVRECCPASSPQIVDTTLCNIEVGRKYFLQDLFGGDCDGPICGAVWAAAPGNEGMNFDDCDNSITFTSNTACGTFTASYTPAGPGAQCGAYNLTLNVEAIDLSPPVLGQPPAICAGNDPAAINIITPASSNATIQYQWQSSTVSCSTGFADIPQATIATYDPPVLSQTMYYRVIVSADECSTGENCRDTSNCVPLLVDPCDFGDLPDNGKGVASGDYETSSANEGACHIVSPNLKLGSNVDQDLDGSPEAMAGQMAGGDDNDTDAPNGGDDEDGIANFPMFVSGRTATINVSVMNMLNPLTTAYLYGFIDWNNDGDFSDLGETVVANVASAATSIDLVFNVPVNAALNRKLGARFRISTDDALGANSPNGCAPDGEVEDYMVTVMGFDYGDLADSAPGIGAGNYETQNGNNGPNHKISTDPNTGAVTLKIGSTVDAEGDGQQNANADGDGADDDGVVLPMLEAGVPVDIAVNVMNMTGGDAKLVMFVDWNGDGDFDDTNEMFSVTVPNNATEVTLNDVTPPLDAVLNRNLGIRFRLSDDLAFINNMSSFGPVNGGEVEDYTAQVMGFDYGDLPYNGVALGTGNPVASYATTDTQDGANHKIITDTNGPILKMGATIDNEVDGQPNVDADGDEAIAAPSGDDEDGIANFPLFIPGQVANITVSVMNRGDDATLYGFIDWNKDGLFTGTGETESVAVNAGFMGNVVIAFNVPIDAMADMNLGARFRLTTQNGIGATGSAPDGEVEDYLVRLADLDFGDLADAGTGTGSGNYETVLLRVVRIT